MGMTSARKLREIVTNVEAIMAVEVLCAAQAIDLQKPETLGQGTAAAHEQVRGAIPHLDGDRLLSRDIEAVLTLERKGTIVAAVEQSIGTLE